MLSESILHDCMVQLLLSPTDEKSLECFAVLITTAGKELEMGGAKVGVVSTEYLWVMCHSPFVVQDRPVFW